MEILPLVTRISQRGFLINFYVKKAYSPRSLLKGQALSLAFSFEPTDVGYLS